MESEGQAQPQSDELPPEERPKGKGHGGRTTPTNSPSRSCWRPGSPTAKHSGFESEPSGSGIAIPWGYCTATPTHASGPGPAGAVGRHRRTGSRIYGTTIAASPEHLRRLPSPTAGLPDTSGGPARAVTRQAVSGGANGPQRCRDPPQHSAEFPERVAGSPSRTAASPNQKPDSLERSAAFDFCHALSPCQSITCRCPSLLV